MSTDVGQHEGLPNWPEPITGGKYLRMLEKHLRGLREAGAHGNRQLFLDDVLIAHLLAFFNPTLRSLRTFEDFSQDAGKRSATSRCVGSARARCPISIAWRNPAC